MLTSLCFVIHTSICSISKFKDACHWLVPDSKVFLKCTKLLIMPFLSLRTVRVEGNFKKHTQTNISWNFKCLQAQDFTRNIQTLARFSATPLLIFLSLFISVRGNKHVAFLSLFFIVSISSETKQPKQSSHLTFFLFTSVNNAFTF